MDLTFREAGGLKIPFAESGQGASETVVLTSSWPESVLAFRKVWDRLAEQFHVIAIDLPGYGQSERRDKGISRSVRERVGIGPNALRSS